MAKVPIPTFSNDPLGRAFRATCETIDAGGDIDSALTQLTRLVDGDNRARARQADIKHRARVQAASGDLVELRRIANENMKKRKGY